MRISLVGIDPGIVDTGVVWLDIYPSRRGFHSGGFAVKGMGEEAVEEILRKLPDLAATSHFYVEKFRPRSHFAHDDKMVTGCRDLARAFDGKLIDNSGIKKIITPSQLQMFEIDGPWPSTHHGDILSAARILLLGAFKDPELNEIFYDFFTHSSRVHRI